MVGSTLRFLAAYSCGNTSDSKVCTDVAVPRFGLRFCTHLSRRSLVNPLIALIYLDISNTLLVVRGHWCCICTKKLGNANSPRPDGPDFISKEWRPAATTIRARNETRKNPLTESLYYNLPQIPVGSGTPLQPTTATARIANREQLMTAPD
jgi:hypothetical protein